MDCWWLVCPTILLGLFVVYKLLDRILRIPYIGRYSDRCIFVTGCDTGFGNALVKRLDSLGCHVFAGCLTEKGETELRKTCSDRVQTISLDITKPDSVQRVYGVVNSKLNAGAVRGLWAVVNNAGIFGTLGPPEWLTIDDYRKVMDVNLYGMIDVTMTFLPLIKQSRGRVVNASSYCGRLAVAGASPYCTSKFGVEAFSDGLRRSLRPYGCKVSMLEPGVFRTSMTALSNIQAMIDATWKKTSPEIKQEFGEEYHDFMRGEFLQFTDKTTSTDLSPVVDTYVHAILGRYPRARYNPGWDSRVLVFLAVLPEWLSDWSLEFLMPRLPLPTFVKERRQ